MEKRKLPHGNEELSVLGLGSASLQNANEDEIKAIIKEALKNGINFFDLCAGGASVYKPFGEALKENNNEVYFQLHFGAVYKKNGEYEWSRNLKRIQETFAWEYKLLGIKTIPFGFLHCIDDENDLEEIQKNGILKYVVSLKNQGLIKHLGFSSHTPAIAHKLLDTGIMDMMMFSINAAYDFEQGDDYGIGSLEERSNLFRRCEAEGVGISVMKPFNGGQLLNERTSPFKKALSKEQCLAYVLDRPAVLSAVPGVRSLDDLKDLLHFLNASKSEKDYSLISQFSAPKLLGNCVYCNHCEPCPAGIDIGLVNKYYDLSLAGDKMAHNHYSKLKIKAENCLSCGHCNQRCPFKVKQMERMHKIAEYFAS